MTWFFGNGSSDLFLFTHFWWGHVYLTSFFIHFCTLCSKYNIKYTNIVLVIFQGCSETHYGIYNTSSGWSKLTFNLQIVNINCEYIGKSRKPLKGTSSALLIFFKSYCATHIHKDLILCKILLRAIFCQTIPKNDIHSSRQLHVQS